MKLPMRIDTHSIEAEAGKIFINSIPSKWIVRETNERDYGIDYYVELVKKSGEVAGDMVFIQLKGTESLDWKINDGKYIATFSGIKQATLNYWMSMQVPVMFCVADTKNKQLYFVPAKKSIREQYGKFQTQDSITFYIKKEYCLGDQVGMGVFILEYLNERYYEEFKYHLINTVVNIYSYIEHMESSIGLDSFLPVEGSEVLYFRQLYISLMKVSQFLYIEWDVMKLSDVYKSSKKFNDGYLLHNETRDRVYLQILKLLPKIIDASLNLVIKNQSDYWKDHDYQLYMYCEELHYKGVEEIMQRCEYLLR